MSTLGRRLRGRRGKVTMPSPSAAEYSGRQVLIPGTRRAVPHPLSLKTRQAVRLAEQEARDKAAEQEQTA